MEEHAVPVNARALDVGVGKGGSWHDLGDFIESSTDESAGKPSLGLRESGVVSTGRAVTSPGEPAESTEVEFGAVRGRRTPVDVQMTSSVRRRR